ncbi:unnamed protein product [Calypogeia fissa]
MVIGLQRTIYYDEIEHREDAGTPPIVQKIRTALVFWVKEIMTVELISSREYFFIEEAMARLGANPNVDIYGPTTVKRVAILSFGVYRSLYLPSRVKSHIDNEDCEDRSPKSTSSSDSSAALSQLQWKPRISKERSPGYPTQKGKGARFFGMNPLEKTFVFGGARSPLLLKDPDKQENGVPIAQTQGRHLSGRFIVKLLNDLFGIQARGGCSCAATYGHNLLRVNTEQSLAFREEIRKVRGIHTDKYDSELSGLSVYVKSRCCVNG